ncbi:MAG: phytase [Pseudomonadota bacterium]
MRCFFWIALLLSSACATAPSIERSTLTRSQTVSSVIADIETSEVASKGDAADDPAIWVHPDNSAKSLILGTDKQAGLYVYTLTGDSVQFLPVGRLNNVDLRQNVTLFGRQGDYAAASNRSDDSITLFTIDPSGIVRELGGFSSSLPEPYGLCLGTVDLALVVFVTYKTGDLIAYRIVSDTEGRQLSRRKFSTQLEGCVFDDVNQVLYVGEENKGIWRTSYSGTEFSAPALIDRVSGENGLVADVEGLAIYRKANNAFLLASSQGNNSFAVYDLQTGSFLSRFSIDANNAIDGVEETDGIDASSAPMGPKYPQGIFIVQDGTNRPASNKQNFKIIDWRKVKSILNPSHND